MTINTTYGHTHSSKHDAQIMCDRDAFMITGMIRFDTSYASGGETLDLSTYFTKVLFVAFDSASGATASTNRQVGFSARYDYNPTVASAKIVLLGGGGDPGGTHDEVQSRLDTSTYSIRFMAVGY